jgi:hypothetical protein
VNTKIDIPSEMLEPFAAMLVGRLFARVTEAKEAGDAHAIESAYAALWWGVHGLNKIAIAVSTATHFSIAAANHIRFVAELVRDDLGIDVFTHPMWKSV